MRWSSVWLCATGAKPSENAPFWSLMLRQPARSTAVSTPRVKPGHALSG